MGEINKMPMVYEPILDGKNPPIGVDSVMLGESGTGSIRLSCFSGNAFVEREEQMVSPDGSPLMREWVRPVCVIDISAGAVGYVEGYLLYRLSQNIDELRRILSQTPELSEKLRTALKEV